MTLALPYTAIWILDFEYIAREGEHPQVVCMVAHDLTSGRWIRVWQGEFGSPPFPINDQTLFVGYSAVAEWSCFIALGWPMPKRCIDLFAEFIAAMNGSVNGKLFPSLIFAALQFGVPTMDADHKGEMRDLILSGGPWSREEKDQITEYCAADVRITGDLFTAMLPNITTSRLALGGALFRGRYTCAVARMEWKGVPVDTVALHRLRDAWDQCRLDLVVEIDRDYSVYEGKTFSTARFDNWLAVNKIPWPRSDTGALRLDDETFRQQAKIYTIVGPLRELRHSLSQFRITSLSVGSDGRARTAIMPFASKTGRNQPSNSRFIFGASRWLRGLIKPGPGRFVAYVDWVSQEIAVAAALSGDQALWAAYKSGDPYMAFAIQAGFAPEGATKVTHKSERQRAKIIVLGVGYGMSAEAMAEQAGIHISEARELLHRHKTTYATFWRWATANQNAGLIGMTLQTRFGWTWKAGTGTEPNPRSLLNWPMQANGAEMMRLACCLLTEQGIEVCCPVHDALLVEGPISERDTIIAATRTAMEQASEAVLGSGYTIATDVSVVNYPDRYEDEGGVEMWNRVFALLDARGW